MLLFGQPDEIAEQPRFDLSSSLSRHQTKLHASLSVRTDGNFKWPLSSPCRCRVARLLARRVSGIRVGPCSAEISAEVEASSFGQSLQVGCTFPQCTLLRRSRTVSTLLPPKQIFTPRLHFLGWARVSWPTRSLAQLRHILHPGFNLIQANLSSIGLQAEARQPTHAAARCLIPTHLIALGIFPVISPSNGIRDRRPARMAGGIDPGTENSMIPAVLRSPALCLRSALLLGGPRRQHRNGRLRGRRARPDLQALHRVQMAYRRTTSLRPTASTIRWWRRRRLPFHGAGERAASRAGSASPRRSPTSRWPAGRSGPIRFKAEVRAGRRHVPQAPLAVLQEDADRARLRHQAERAGLHGLLGHA